MSGIACLDIAAARQAFGSEFEQCTFLDHGGSAPLRDCTLVTQ